jgi:hypothetical protein
MRLLQLLYCGTERSLDLKRNPHVGGVSGIRLRGHLSPQWADWFEDVTLLNMSEGETLLFAFCTDCLLVHSIVKICNNSPI